MDPRVAETLLSLHTRPPLDACTYIGLDNGAQPLSVSYCVGVGVWVWVWVWVLLG